MRKGRGSFQRSMCLARRPICLSVPVCECHSGYRQSCLLECNSCAGNVFPIAACAGTVFPLTPERAPYRDERGTTVQLHVPLPLKPWMPGEALAPCLAMLRSCSHSHRIDSSACLYGHRKHVVETPCPDSSVCQACFRVQSLPTEVMQGIGAALSVCLAAVTVVGWSAMRPGRRVQWSPSCA